MTSFGLWRQFLTHRHTKTCAYRLSNGIAYDLLQCWNNLLFRAAWTISTYILQWCNTILPTVTEKTPHLQEILCQTYGHMIKIISTYICWNVNIILNYYWNEVTLWLSHRDINIPGNLVWWQFVSHLFAIWPVAFREVLYSQLLKETTGLFITIFFYISREPSKTPLTIWIKPKKETEITATWMKKTFLSFFVDFFSSNIICLKQQI